MSVLLGIGLGELWECVGDGDSVMPAAARLAAARLSMSPGPLPSEGPQAANVRVIRPAVAVRRVLRRCIAEG